MRPKTRMTDVNVGDVIVADGGFTCMEGGGKVVKKDGERLYVECAEGKHFLDGQLNDADDLVGFSRPT